MKKLLSIVTLSALLPFFSGFSSALAKEPPTFPTQQAAPTNPAAVGGESSSNLEGGTAEFDKMDVLPEVPLTSDILFMLLTAEVAYQRGDWMRAYTIMMSAARDTRDPRLARRAAEMAANARQPEEALNAIRFWRELVPQSEEAARYMLGFILLSDDLSEAEPIFAMRLKQAPAQERGIMIYQIQRLLASLRDKEQAFALLEALVKPYQQMPQAHIALSQNALGKGDNTRAIKEARRALEINPESSLAVLVLVQAIGKADEAESVLADFVSKHPKAKEVRVAYAQVLIAQKKYVFARREFEVLLTANPDDPVALYSLGLLSAQLNDRKSAERYLAAYMKSSKEGEVKESDTLQVLLLLAQLADERGDEQVAMDWLVQIEKRPGHGAAYLSARNKRAQILARQGKLDQARQLLAEAAVKGEGLQVQRIIAESHLLRDAGKHREGLQVLEAGKKQFPDNTRLLYDYAMLAERLEMLPEMETALRRIIVLKPKSHHAYNALGYTFVERDIRLDEARELLERAMNLAPDDAFILDSMGWLYYRLGNLEKAEQYLQRAYEKRQDAEIAAHYGEVLWLRGRKDEARKIWRAATLKERDNDVLQETLKRLDVRP